MKKLLLLDSNSLINRAYYAIPLLSGADGVPTNAVYGFVNMLIRLINEQKPTHIAAAFDLPAPTFRKKMFEGYKAERKGMPDDLAAQVPILKNLLALMNIKTVELAGFEADDIIGTLAARFEGETVIVTGDRDSLQLIDGATRVILTKRGISDVIECNVENMPDVYGVKAAQVVDLKAIMGDKSDGIKGVSGIGEITAKKLINQYGSLESVYDNIENIGGKVAVKLAEGRADAELSYRLAKIECDAPIKTEEDELKFDFPFSAQVKREMLKLGFKSVVSRLKFEEDGEKVQSAFSTELDSPTERVSITTEEGLKAVAEEIKRAGVMAFINGGTVELACCMSRNYSVLINGGTLCGGLDFEIVITTIKELLNDKDIKKLCFDFKTEKHLLEPFSGLVGLWQDVMLEAYLVNSSVNYKNFAECLGALGVDAADGAAGLFKAHEYYSKEIERLGLSHVYYDIELPLVGVLYDMETEGFSVDTAMLEKLGAQYREELDGLVAEIYELAGEPFNINSPKQMGAVLFDKLGLKHPSRKNKSGNYSTDAETLEKLRFDHPIVGLLLRYRDISKLQSTYIEGMRPLVRDGKIHTVFRQAVTSTGRLSSTEPNLQNIPIRKEEGAKLRAMFRASEGRILVCADYSQIELRLLAAFSGDKTLTDAFARGDDIHTVTAAAAYGLPKELITPAMRRSAKAVNFGIIYGMSDFGLAADLGVPVWEARRFIEKFFETYPDVKTYIDSNVEFAKQNGFVRSMSGRIRFLPEIRAAKYSVRQFAERAAMNMPLQGSASDIIKIAMIKASAAFAENGMKTRLIMQVHDELIADAPDEEADKAAELLKQAMESAVDLSVKLIADTDTGHTWQEAK